MVQKSYAKFNPKITFSEDTYVIIGSGMGGLTTAVFLAKAGKKVVVLEQHYVPGGFTHTFKRKGGFTKYFGSFQVLSVAKTQHAKNLFTCIGNCLPTLNFTVSGLLKQQFRIPECVAGSS